MRLNYTLLFVLGFLTLRLGLQAQVSPHTVKYKVSYDAPTQLYTVWVVPDYNVPNIYNSGTTERGGTAQVTLVVPRSFIITNIVDVNGNWVKDTDPSFIKFGPGQANQSWPGLNPNLNYYIIGKSPTETNYGTFTIGIAVKLFTFRGNGCFGAIGVLAPNDPFAIAADQIYSLNVNSSFYSRSGQPLGGNQPPLEQFIGATANPAACYSSVLVANMDTATTLSGDTKNILVLTNDRAGNGSAATLSLVSPPSVSTLPINGSATVRPDGSIDYTPRANFVGIDSFYYTICDSTLLSFCSTALVRISVSAARRACSSDTIKPQIILTHPLLANTQTGDTLTLSCINPPIFGIQNARAIDNSDNSPRLSFADIGHRIGSCIRDGFKAFMSCQWKAVDSCGNEAVFTIFIKLTDNTAPNLLGIPVDLTINTDVGQSPPSVPTVVANDDCGAASLSFRQDSTSIAGSCDYLLRRIWTATDECGNSTSQIQNIRVQKTCCLDFVAQSSFTVVFTNNCTELKEVCIPILPNANILAITNNGAAYTQSIQNCTDGINLRLGVGENRLILRNATNCFDTVLVRIICTTPMAQRIELPLAINKRDTILLETAELYGNRFTVRIMSHTNDSLVKIQRLSGATAISRTGLNLGIAQTVIVVSDEYGITDTTYLKTTVLNSNFSRLPQANFDSLQTNKNKILVFNILSNDSIGSGILRGGNLVETPKYGKASLFSNGLLLYTPENNFCGKDVLTYALCSSVGCDTAKVLIQVICQDLTIYTGFSPNNDGVNDYFTIEAIENFPHNTLQIYDPRGRQVFEAKGYKNEWGGTYQNKLLPSSTYFYLLDDGAGHQFSGYLFISY